MSVQVLRCVVNDAITNYVHHQFRCVACLDGTISQSGYVGLHASTCMAATPYAPPYAVSSTGIIRLVIGTEINGTEGQVARLMHA